MFLLVIKLIILTAVSVPTATSQASTCDSEILSQAESSFRNRNQSLKVHQQAEVDIKHAIESCPSKRLERRLRIVQEELAMTDLQLATFYLHADGVGQLKAAIYRLKMIDDNYPRFSQMDRVVFMLGDLSDRNGSAHDAANYFRRVVANYPRSPYAPHARKRLAELAANGET
jgi:outer membrane protein assembly factor BamD (BamD/ComL family)